MAAVAEAAAGFTHAVNGRFKGGYITRAYGQPGRGIHALQLELSQITYMDEQPPYSFRDDLAAQIRPRVAPYARSLSRLGRRTVLRRGAREAVGQQP